MKISPHTAALANLQHWRAGQGEKIKANRPKAIYAACEFMAERLAPRRDPLILNADEIKVAVHRAVSRQRFINHGSLTGVNADTWWSQIEPILTAWNIPANRSEWESGVPQQQEAA